MKKLVIVESPTKAKTISDILKKEDAEVIASMGHIRDIPENGLNVDLKTFKPKYEISSDKKEIVKKIKSALKNSQELYLATDEDREGESISWHLNEVLKPTITTKRMVFHEITPSAIKKAFTSTREINMNMVSAQESRRVLDRLVGYEVSPLMWKNLGNRYLSAGRVQSPTLKLVVDREYRRMSFISSFYNTIKAKFKTLKGDEIESKLISINGKKIVSSKDDFDPDTGEVINKDLVLLDEKNAEKYKSIIEKSNYNVSKIIKKEIKTLPPVPFITSTLQQEANTKLHFSSSKTMQVAQRLYEKGFITYMRTDSPTLSLDGENAIRHAIEANLSSDKMSPFPRRFKSKDENAQNAHEAIRPAILDGVIKTSGELQLTVDEMKLYNLIYRRSLASQMLENIRESTNLRIMNDDSGDVFEFSSSGYTTIQEGFREIYNTIDDKDDKILPNINEGDILKFINLAINETQTTPPRRWTEATLIREMEKLGIGRPSTYATIISSLINKKYIERAEGVFIPTFTGLLVIKFLSKHLPQFLDYSFTSRMEDSLDEIENNKVNEFEYLENFYHGQNGLKESLDFNVEDRHEEQQLFLPKISNEYAIYCGKYGPYINFNNNTFSISSNIFPYMLSDDKIKEIIDNKQNGNESKFEIVAHDESSGKEILYNDKGKYGPYFFIKDIKKSVRLPKGYKKEDLTEKEIAKLFMIPFELGKDNDGNSVMVNNGKYGYYLSYKNKNLSLNDVRKILNLELNDAIGLFKKFES